MSYSFWRPPTLAPGGVCPPEPPSYATGKQAEAPPIPPILLSINENL